MVAYSPSSTKKQAFAERTVTMNSAVFSKPIPKAVYDTKDFRFLIGKICLNLQRKSTEPFPGIPI